MGEPGFLQTAAFALTAALILTAAFWVVTLRNLFRAALCLGLVLLGVAGLFILLHAEFLAFAQVLVYVGAILTMVVFAIMLTQKLQTRVDAPDAVWSATAAAASGGLFALLAFATWAAPWSAEALLPNPATPAAIGQQLVTTLVLPFEVVSLVFVAAMIGAMELASGSKRRKGPC